MTSELSSLSPDILIQELSPYMDYASIKNLRNTCHFFYDNRALKKIEYMKKFKLFSFGEQMILWRGDGKLFAFKLEEINPEKIKVEEIPTIAKVIQLTVANSHLVYQVETGEWYGFGKNHYGQLLIDKHMQEIHTQLPINAIKVIVGNQQTFYCNQDLSWHAHGLNNIWQLGCTDPGQVLLPNDELIETIVPATHVSFFKSKLGHWFASGSLKFLSNSEMDGDMYAVATRPMPLKLYGQSIQKVITSETHIFMCDLDERWYGFGSNDFYQMMTKDFKAVYHLSLPLKITHIVPADSHVYYRDGKGNWFAAGFNGHQGEFGKAIKDYYVASPIEISLPNGEPILDIIPAKNATFFHTTEGNFYLSTKNSQSPKLAHFALTQPFISSETTNSTLLADIRRNTI